MAHVNQHTFLSGVFSNFILSEKRKTCKLLYACFLFAAAVFFMSSEAFALSDTVKIPVYRQFFHDKIKKEQQRFDLLDGKQDDVFRVGNNDEINLRVTEALYGKVDDLKNWIELNDSIAKNNDKIRLLTYIERTLLTFRVALKKRTIAGTDFPAVINCLDSIVKGQEKQRSIAPIVSEQSYPVAKLLTQIFDDNIGHKEAENILYLKYCEIHPENILNTIRPYVDESFADSLIAVACQKNPAQLYSYAQSVSTPEGKLIHRSSHPLVKSVADLSRTPNALLYFPFLDDILSGKNSIENIRSYLGEDDEHYDSVGYFRMLVKTEKEYFRRMTSIAKDTPIAMFGPNGLREVLKDRAIRHFITPINNLHDENNLAIRMKAIAPLTPEELYYMLVMGENDIFTSSYKHSFNDMLQKLGNTPQTDLLLQEVYFDYFKKFIKMAASYNKLDTFLKCMPPQNSASLMKAFVANLDNSSSLEDATDVADSYSSISNRRLQKTILRYVIENEEQCIRDANENGMTIYGLLKNIFLSEDKNNHIDLTSIAGIPSIYEINKTELMDESGRIVEQVFFYGDEDGKIYFPPFLNSFSPKEWKITKNKEWVEIKSLKSNVYVYANLPLDYDANLDDSAQVHLNNFLESNEMHPSIVIHRGHSYWLPGTISRMPENTKIVLLGSCGGYKNLNQILELSPDAHIISTKEIGAGDINRPIINYLNQALVSNDKIEWSEMWKSLTAQFSTDPNKSIKESWESYIPPYKNLGAIFIKAYAKKMESY